MLTSDPVTAPAVPSQGVRRAVNIDASVERIAWERVELNLTVRTSRPEFVDVPWAEPATGADLAASRTPLDDAAADEDSSLASLPEDPEHVEAGLGFELWAGQRRLSIPSVRDEQGVHVLTINVTNFHDRRQVPNGTWHIVPVFGGEPVGRPLVFPLDRVGELDQDSRTFLYNANKSAYVVNFDISEDDVRPHFLVRTYALGRGGKGKKSGPLGKVKKKLTGRDTRVKMAQRLYRTARRLDPPNGRRVMFASEARTQIGGNLLQVRDRMTERGLHESYDFRYSFRTPRTSTKFSTARTIWLLATSDYVLIDDYFSMLQSLKLDDETTLVQLWHAGSGFKSIGFSRFGRYGSPKLTNSHRSYTYAICGSSHLVPVYAEAFGIEPASVLPTGLPRIDAFLDPERIARVTADFDERYPEFRGKRVVLFAPTFRGRGIKDGYYDYDRLDLDALYESLGEDTVFLFRMHHFIRQAPPIPDRYRDRIVDVADYPDTNDLLHSVDLLITDYSSIIYEYSLLERPMLFFAYDKEIYSATRGFHRDYDLTAPGKVVATSDELIAALRQDDFDTWKIEAFRKDNFDHVDRHSSDRVIDWVILGAPPHEESASLPAPARPIETQQEQHA